MKRYRVEPGSLVSLDEWDPDDESLFDGDKDDGKERLDELTNRLEELQELLYAEHKYKVLIVLQAMDTGGKDGTISHVFEGVNPQGVRVASFKVPTPEELDHDFLWRAHKQVPGKGEMAIFNRSYYEDVLVVRVHKLVPPEVWGLRYRQINDFERMLSETGTAILKFYLHIDKEEQKERLEDRLKEPDKYWKFHKADLKERDFWPEYMEAYQDAISKTSTSWAPWYIVPSNHKWYRNLVVATILVNTLKGLDMHYPPEEEGLDKIKID